MDAEGLFALDLDGGASTGYLLSVRDALGREVLTRSVRAVALQREPLDLRGLSAGSYTVAVRSGPTQWTARLVKP
jgi:hypothetical protein